MRFIRKHGIWLVLATLVGLVGAWLIVSGRPVGYSSTSDLDVEARVITGTVPVTPNLATEERVATSGDVLSKAAPELGLLPGQLGADLKVSVSGTSTILTIGCTMPTPVAAQHCNAVVTQAYIDFRNHTAESKTAQQHDPLNVTLVTPATLPLTPAGSKKSELLAIGGFLGFLLGLGGAYARDRADNRVRDREDLSQNLEAPVLTAIPGSRWKFLPNIAVLRDPRGSATAEAFRYLRVRIDSYLSTSTDKGCVVLTTGPRGGEGSTTVAFNLAAAIAQSGSRVILVDGDLQSRSLSERYGAAGLPGLTDLLTGLASRASVTVPTNVPMLCLVPAGMSLDGAALVFDSTTLARTFSQLAMSADVVIVDSAPVLAVSSPVALASVSQVVVVAASTRHTTRADLRAVRQELADSDDRHVVGVLTGASHARMLPPLPTPSLVPQTANGSGPGRSQHTAGAAGSDGGIQASMAAHMLQSGSANGREATPRLQSS